MRRVPILRKPLVHDRGRVQRRLGIHERLHHDGLKIFVSKRCLKIQENTRRSVVRRGKNQRRRLRTVQAAVCDQ